jgi:STE24 endopeptidase
MRRNLGFISVLVAFCLSFAVFSIHRMSWAQSTAPAKDASVGQATTPTGQISKPEAIRANAGHEREKVEAYTLTAEQREKAIAYSKARYRLYFISVVYSLALLYFLMRLQWPVKFGRWAEGPGQRRRFLQLLIFAPLFVATLQVMSLPVNYYGEHLRKLYGLSVQSFGSWAWDWLKGLCVGVIISTLLIWILYGVIRRSPKWWWLYFWLGTLPIIVFLIFLQPVVIEPLFFKFTPLQQTQPKLTAELTEIVQRAGLNISQSRMFLMDASTKTKELNAYVTGIGATKRLVVWDTTIAKMNPEEVTFVFGHEAGHYVLYHIPKMIVEMWLVALVLFYLGYRLVNWAIPRWQVWSGVGGISAWGSLTIILFFMTFLSFLASPLENGISRHYEHQADIYGLEVTHGIVPDAPQNAARAFQILGEVDLADPDPNPLIKVWLYSHPPVNERVDFALRYNPWGEGRSPEFVKGK